MGLKQRRGFRGGEASDTELNPSVKGSADLMFFIILDGYLMFFSINVNGIVVVVVE